MKFTQSGLTRPGRAERDRRELVENQLASMELAVVTARAHTAWQEMKVELGLAHDNRVPGVVPTGEPGAHVNLAAEDVDELCCVLLLSALAACSREEALLRLDSDALPLPSSPHWLPSTTRALFWNVTGCADVIFAAFSHSMQSAPPLLSSPAAAALEGKSESQGWTPLPLSVLPACSPARAWE